MNYFLWFILVLVVDILNLWFKEYKIQLQCFLKKFKNNKNMRNKLN